ncbi:MAG: hypothetical protein J6Y76_04670, partial [Paludibacteraceae bacterium]|nr:hypothetical protein [Paludibacteraceae bacterium]
VYLSAADKRAILHPNSEPLQAPEAGKVLWELDFEDQSHAPVFGKAFRQNETMAYIETLHGMVAIPAPYDCMIVSVVKEQGAKAAKGDDLAWFEKADLPQPTLTEKVTEVMENLAKKAQELIKEPVAAPEPKSKWNRPGSKR